MIGSTASIDPPDQAEERLEQSITVRTPLAHGRRVDMLKKISGMTDFLVSSFPSTFGCTIQRPRDIGLVHIFEIRVVKRQDIFPKTMPVVLGERILIGNDPGLHGLNHQMNDIVDVLQIPSIPAGQMLGSGSSTYTGFRVHQEHDDSTFHFRVRVTKMSVCLITRAATHKGPTPALLPAGSLDVG